MRAHTSIRTSDSSPAAVSLTVALIVAVLLTLIAV
jgi:Tfp pilus assembly protein PilX